MHRLRNEAKSIKIRNSLENFICKYNNDAAINSHFTYFEHNVISSNNLYDNIDRAPVKDLDDTDDMFHEEIDDNYIEEPKKVRAENEKVLLQIPVELLPCPQDVKTVTDRTYTHPSQNEVKDYRNFILSSKTNKLKACKIFLIPLIVALFAFKFVM